MRPSTAEYVKLSSYADDCKAFLARSAPRQPQTTSKVRRWTWRHARIRAHQVLLVSVGLAINFILVCFAISYLTYIFTKESSEPPTSISGANTTATAALPLDLPSDFNHLKTIVEWGTSAGIIILAVIVLGAELGCLLLVIAFVSVFTMLLVKDLETKLKDEAPKVDWRAALV